MSSTYFISLVPIISTPQLVTVFFPLLSLRCISSLQVHISNYFCYHCRLSSKAYLEFMPLFDIWFYFSFEMIPVLFLLFTWIFCIYQRFYWVIVLDLGRKY